MRQAVIVILAGLTLVACGDDADGGETCPDGSVEGSTVNCDCSGGAVGVQTCSAAGTLGECECPSDAEGSGDAAASSAASGSSDAPASGSDGGTTQPAQGAGDTMDGGTTPTPPSDAAVPMTTPTAPAAPTDGNQNAACEADIDCNQGLGCYTNAGYCSAACSEDADCEGIAGASYTCSTSSGLCRVECSGTDDDASCPSGMVCSGTGGVFRCTYPVVGAGQNEACATTADCGEGLGCYGAGGGGGFGATGGGFCTLVCDDDAACAGLSGATYACSGNSNLCRVQCDSAGDGSDCPAGMVCSGSRCSLQ
ncbi:MAG: hypothetical protein OEZ06_23870 [Myxococcales bacterium]|nr:hypothetical protein [Myxococcales bacterium]